MAYVSNKKRSMSTTLELFCWVFGEPAKRIFPIRIDKQQTVGDLQKAIKNNKRAFRNVDADFLDLHQVSILVDQDFEQKLRVLKLDNGLSPVNRLWKVFSDGPKDGHIHIVVTTDAAFSPSSSNESNFAPSTSRKRSHPPTAEDGQAVKRNAPHRGIKKRGRESQGVDKKSLRTNCASSSYGDEYADTQREADSMDVSDVASDILKHDKPPPDNAPKHSDDWLFEIHAGLWAREDLRKQLFHEVTVTVADYHALEERLKVLHPDHESSKYAPSALSTKLDFLQAVQAAQTIETTQVTEATTAVPASLSPQGHSVNEPVAENDEENDDVELSLFLPAAFSYLDLSSLRLSHWPHRLPLPIFIRQEYGIISGLIEERPLDSSGSVIVSGQPGTGKTTFLQLEIIDFMISGREFLYQSITGVVYHVSQEVKRITSWPSAEDHITAFVDADSESGKPRSPSPLLFEPSVKIVVASSPGGTDQKWLKQGNPDQFVSVLAAALWSPAELYLAGIFLHPRYITFMRLKESVSYFGFNPRRCFAASKSPMYMKQVKKSIVTNIRSFAESDNLKKLLVGAYRSVGISHAVFEISPTDDDRDLYAARIGVVSSWALDTLLKAYEDSRRDDVADFYELLTRVPDGASIRGRMWERQVLRYFDAFKGPHELFIRSLAKLTTSKWTYGPTTCVTFDSFSFTPSLLPAAEGQMSHHLVPEDSNFSAVDSILYDSAGVLTCIQATISPRHPIAVKGLSCIQRWLKRKTGLRPSAIKKWRLIFVVPDNIEPDFGLQHFEGDTSQGEWARKVDQYVLAIKEDTIFRGAM